MNNSSETRHTYVRLGLIVVAVLIVLGGVPVAVWVGSSGSEATVREAPSSSAAGTNGESAGLRKTRSSIRPEAGPKATHGPHQLRDFYLPPLDFDGILLADALERVRAAYGEACRKSGEQPLQLVFSLPPGVNPVLRTKTRHRTLESTVQLLAGVAKLTVKRHGREFRFAAPHESDGRVVKREFDMPFGINGADYLAKLGIILDPGTRVVSSPGSLMIETSSAADLAAGGSVALSLAMDPPVSQKLTAKLVTLPAGADWPHADQSIISDFEVQTMMRGLSLQKGVELMTLPSVLSKPEQDAKIEIIREVIARSDDPGGGFEVHPVGVVLDSNLYPLGFGHQVNSDLSITAGEVDPATGRAVIEHQADISCDTFSTDSGTVVKVQTHPDGSRTVLMVTPLLVDATGAPVREREDP